MNSIQMIFVIAFQAIVINSYPAPTLKNELEQFTNVINFQRISEITREYWENDVNIQELIKYLKSDKFKSAWHNFISSEEVDNIIQWMTSRMDDVNVQLLIENLTEDIVSIHQSSLRNERKLFEQFSLRTFEDEIRNEIKIDELNALIEDFINDGNDFAHLYLILKVSKPTFEGIFRANEIQDVMNDLRMLGVNIDYLKIIVYGLLRWNL